MKKVLFLFIAFLIISCKGETAKEKDELFAQLREEFPLTITNADIVKVGGRYELKITGYVENKSEHFLNSLYINPEIHYIRKPENESKYVSFNKFNVVQSDTFDKQTTTHFSESIAFPQDFNPDEFRYEIENSILELNMEGNNSTGYNFDSAPAWGTGVYDYGFEFGPLLSHDLTQEWEKYIVD